MKCKKFLSLLLAAIMLLSFGGCAREAISQTNTSESAENIHQGDPVSPSEAKKFEERAVYLYSDGVYPELWWAEGSNANNLGEDLNRPLDLQLPETEYYHIDRFQSIDELKKATEEVFTKEYAEKYLYPWGEDHQMFVEHDGELYANAYWMGEFLFPPDSVTFLRKEGDVVFLDANFKNLDGEPFTRETQLKLEDGVWKFQYTYLTEFFQEMLSKE